MFISYTSLFMTNLKKVLDLKGDKNHLLTNNIPIFIKWKDKQNQ
jgi:hypothetical protein